MAERFMARTENKGAAELRVWELDEDSTRYDYLLAAPADNELVKYWTAWAVISTFGGTFVAVILIGILSSRSVRKRSFNLYLIYLMIPDAVYSILCGMVCLAHAINGSQIAELCNFQMMFIVWGVGSNMYLNAAVSHQLHKMLRGSDIRQRYQLPTPRFVTKQALAIYAFTLFLGSWGLIESNKFPHYVASTSGLACLPVEHDWKSSLFFWLVFFPLFGGIPILYIQYVCYDIWKRNLLPPAGKRRLLAIYFGRIVVVFVLMWVPYMILLFMFATFMPTEVHFYGGTLSHLQGAVSASLCLLKPDIAWAVKRFLTCKCWGEEDLESLSFSVGGKRTNSSSQKRQTNSSGAASSGSRMRDFLSENFGRSTQQMSSSLRPFRPPNPNNRQEPREEVDVLPTPMEDVSGSDPLGDSLWPDDDGVYRTSTHTEEDENESVADGESCQEDDDAETGQQHPIASPDADAD